MIESIGVIGHDPELVSQLAEVLRVRFESLGCEIVEQNLGAFTVYVDCGPMDEEWREPERYDYRVVDLNFAHYADVLYGALATTN